MKYVMFGNTGMKVSRLSLGAMTLGGRVDQKTSARVVDEALDHGVNLIDTGDSYGDSEETLGEILSGAKRERVFLATKVFRRFCRDGRVGRNSRVNLIHALERSLRLLKTDYVDLYQLHHPDEETPIEETLMTLDTLVKQGKIRYYGVSNHYAWQMAHMIGESKAHGWEPLVSIQPNYNVLDRQVERETIPFCRRFNIALMCYGPLCGGILTGKYHAKEEIPKGSRGETNPKVQDYLRDKRVAGIVEDLRRIGEEHHLRMNQLAILWLLAKPDATTIIVGGSRPEHFTQIYDIADSEIPQSVVEKIDEISEDRIHTPFANQPIVEGPRISGQRA
jgi:aryl-alcohol dehydrogenase-like predicted oxidoreductase